MRGVIAALLLTGCGSIATMRGARILEAGEREHHFAVTAATAVDPVQGWTPLPRPRLDVMIRRPVAPDVDLGLALLGGAPSIDLRIRAARTRRLHVALDPTVVGAYLPQDLTPGSEDSAGVRGLGFAEVASPLLAEWDFGRGASLTAGLRPGLRVVFVDTSSKGTYYTDDVATVDFLLGGGLRFERRGTKVGWGLSADVLTRPWRAAPIGASATFDLMVLRHRRADSLRGAVRRDARGRK